MTITANPTPRPERACPRNLIQNCLLHQSTPPLVLSEDLEQHCLHTLTPTQASKPQWPSTWLLAFSSGSHLPTERNQTPKFSFHDLVDFDHHSLAQNQDLTIRALPPRLPSPAKLMSLLHSPICACYLFCLTPALSLILTF